MSLTVYTDSPESLLRRIKAAIDEGRIVTWEYDSDGDFTHATSSGQWEGKAWLKPHTMQGVLAFGLLGVKDATMTKALYAVYHGRFIEMLLTHFDVEFKNVTATAFGDSFDDYKAGS